MPIEFSSRHVVLDDRLRAWTEERLGHALRFLRDPIDVRIALEGTAGDKHLVAAEIHVLHRHGDLHARDEDVDVKEALGRAVAAIEVQAQRGREKSVDRRRRPPRAAPAGSPDSTGSDSER